nr:hypothetical protein [Tanacetum cinerariifolium]
MEIRLNRSRLMNGTDLDRGASHRSRSRTMDTTIDQQVAMDEALIPHAKRLRIGRSNFRLLSDIKSKESTLQLVYDVLACVHSSRLSWSPSNTKIQRRAMRCIILDSRRDDHMFSTIKLVSRYQNTQQFGALLPIELTNEEIRNSNAYKEYYVVATGAAPPKPKASVRKTRSSFDTTITPLTTAAVTKRSLQQTHISQASGSGADEGTGSITGVPNVPIDESEEELSWNSINEEGNDDEGKDGDGDGDEEDDGDDGEEGDGNDDDDEEDDDDEKGDDDDDQEVKRDDEKDDEEEGGDDEQESDEEEFIHPSLSTHTEEEPKDEESFDPIPKTPEDSDDEGNGEKNLRLNVGREEGHDEEEEADELYKDVNINQGRGIQTTQEVEDSHVTLTLVNPDGQQQSSSVSSQFVTSMLNPTLDVEANFSEFMQTNQFAGAVFAIPRIVQRYMNQRMNEAVKVVVQIQSDRLHGKAQKDNDEFLKTIDENMQKIIKEQVKEHVKVQVFKILPKIEQTVNEQLEAEVLTRSSHSSKTSYVVAADLSEMELKKIIIKKMEGNKTIQRSDEQKNLYKALVEAYESDKIILDTYRETVTLKRCHDDDAKDEEPSAGPDRGSKRRREGKEPDESAFAEEPMQTTFQMEEPSHLEFDTGADDQPMVQSSQHPEWFSQQQKPPTPDHDWNKTLPATHESIQPWISELAKQSDSRSSFNEMMDTPLDFSNFLINRLKVDTLTLELIAGPTYELLKGIIAVTELKIVEWHNNKHLDWITVRRDDDKFYKFKKGDFKRLRIQDIEDMLLLLVQRKLTNLTVEERFAFNVSFRMFTKKHRHPEACGRPSTGCRKLPEEAQPNKVGYNKDKKNRLMRIDELHKFSDGTLTDVRTALDDRLKGIRMRPGGAWRGLLEEGYTRETSGCYKGPYDLSYAAPIFQKPEPEGSTQGYPLVSVELLSGCGIHMVKVGCFYRATMKAA